MLLGLQQVVAGLQVQPKLRLHSEEAAEPKSRVRGNCPLSVNNLSYAALGYADILRQAILGDLHRFQELLFSRPKQTRASGSGSFPMASHPDAVNAPGNAAPERHGPSAQLSITVFILPVLWWGWNDPISYDNPVPQQVFLMYYLVDTDRHNGCLRLISGSHVKRHPMHDAVPDAHTNALREMEDPGSPVYRMVDEAIDVPVKAGNLVIADSRMLHAAWPNCTARRRTLVLLWHDCFPFPSVPSWWEGEVPEEFANPDPGIVVERTRTPGKFLTT